MIETNELRKRLRTDRHALSDAFVQRASQRIIRRLIKLPEFLAAHRVALYYPVSGEINPLHLFKLQERFPDKRFSFPRMRRKGEPLEFYTCYNPKLLRPNRHGIPEPIPSPIQKVLPEQLDLVLVPLVAFDHKKNRMGMGAGYYDLTFSFLNRKTFLRKPLLVGLAHTSQCVPPLSPSPWDVVLDMIITPDRVLR
jgi:5-formyltetrahydrofolate cyclo-ligase